jgi:hypothetical protein
VPTMTLCTKAERRQQRLRKRRQEAMPLFEAAGIADDIQPIPEIPEIESWYRRQAMVTYASALRRERDSLRDWVVYRGMAEEYLTFDQVQRMEHESARIYPSDPLYRGSYWRRFLLAVGLWERVQQIDGRHYPRLDWSQQKYVYWPGAYMELATGEWLSNG